MTVLYRAIWTDTGDPGSLIGTVKARFVDWVESKTGEAPKLDEVSTVSVGGTEAEALENSDGPTTIARFRLREDKGHEYWTTTFITMVSSETPTQAWVWADVEWVDDEAFGTPPVMAAPRLVGQLLQERPGYCGSLLMRPVPSLIQPARVQDRVKELTDPERTAPVFVVSVANGESESSVQQRAMATATRLAGVASVWILPAASGDSFREAIGDSLYVWGGSTRCYLPGVEIDDPRPWRHRYSPAASASVKKAASARWAGRLLAGTATARRPPILYRTKGRELIGAVTDLDYFAEAIELDDQLSEAQLRIEELEFERDETLERLTEATKQADRVTRRNRYLERAFATGEALTEIAEDADSDWEPETCSDVAERVASCFTDTLVLPQSALEDVDELTSSHLAATWALDAWKGFQALNEYVIALRDGYSGGNFYMWCKAGGFPPSQVAMSESETVDKNTRARDARTLGVDTAVDPSGTVYMGAHLKPGGTATDAPRIHFHDDTRGATGKIHVGWFGPHLPVPNRSN